MTVQNSEESLKIVIAQLGARMHYAVPKILNSEGFLTKFYTDIYVEHSLSFNLLDSIIPNSLKPNFFQSLAGRSNSGVPAERIHSFDVFGLRYSLARISAKSHREMDVVFEKYSSNFATKVANAGFLDANTVWGFNTASQEMFKQAKTSGLRCVLEQTMAPLEYTSAKLLQQQKMYSGWSEEAEYCISPSLINREKVEWDLADLIICPSTFVVDSMRSVGGPVDKCVVVPYGVESQKYADADSNRLGNGKSVNILFCGEVGLRKGVPALLQALELLDKETFKCKLAGSISISENKIRQYQDRVEFLGPIPRGEMSRLYAWADVLILPSIVEGSATVIYEAICSGIKVICTHSSGPPVSSHISVIPPNDPDAIVGALEAIACINKSESELGKKADLTNFTLENYKNNLIHALIRHV